MKINFSFITLVLLFVFIGLLSSTYGQWAGHKISKESNPIPSLFVGDIDGDDSLDVVATHNVTDEILWYKNKNAGKIWEEHTIDDSLGGAWLVRIADIDGDDTMDVVATGQGVNDVVWYENNQLSWTKHYIDANFYDARDVEVADIDGDDTLDVIVSSWDGRDVVWYENNHPNWTQYVIDDNLNGANYIHASDIDNDGDQDFIITAWRVDQILWYENDLPNWTKHYIDRNIDGPVIVDVADIDGDGDPDVAATGELDHDVVWYENDQLTWTKHKIDDNLAYSLGVVIADIDGNDTLDVIAAGMNADKVVWYKNDLPNDSWTRQTIGELNNAEYVDVGDIDRDNDIDVILASFGYYAGTNDGDVVWYENILKVAHAKSTQCEPRYIHTEGETLIINARLYNPENHPATVNAIISGEQHAFKDSIQLYDDGLHNDSLVSDNIWGNSKWLSGLPEDMYTIRISSHDSIEDYLYSLPEVRSFTTIGPLEVDSVSMPVFSTMTPNRIAFDVYLKNLSETNTVENVAATFYPDTTDPCFVEMGRDYREFGDIEPLQSVIGQFTMTIDTFYLQDSVMMMPFTVEIVSGDIPFWIDTYEYLIVDDIEEFSGSALVTFDLKQNYPNPFNPRTVISFQLPVVSDVELSIYNLLGQRVVTLVDGHQKSGHHQVEWDASGFASGIYYYRIEAGEFVDVKKMILIR